MAGIEQNTPIPSEIKLHQKSRELELSYQNGAVYRLSYEFLRVHSPSAEVRGHGPGQETLQSGKRKVDITDLRQVGHYAVQPVFSDGHDSGIYSWDLLHRLAVNRDQLWADYLQRLEAAGADRDIDASLRPPAQSGGCGKH